MSEKTAHRRAGDPEFRKKVSGVRAGLIGSTAGILAEEMAEAARALRALLVRRSDGREEGIGAVAGPNWG